MSLIVKKCFFALLFIFASFSSVAEPNDVRLIGNWQGQRNLDGKCSFMAWKMSRTADGKFELTLYGDSDKKQILGKEMGRWEATNGRLSLLTNGVPTPDIYVYTFIDDNSVKLSNIKRDPSADCMADYEFTDHRVPL